MNGLSTSRLRTDSARILASMLFFVVACVARPVMATDLPVVKYDHAAINANWQTTVTVQPGDSFKLVVENTCPEKFEFSSEPIPTAPPRPTVEAPGPCPLGLKELTLVHDNRYSGYIVNIKRTQPGAITVQVSGKPKTLEDVTLVITFAKSPWDYELAGGFTFSQLTDPEFGLVTRTIDGGEETFVVRDRAAEDDLSLGAGAFIHVFHRRNLRPLALTFGLGISEQAAPAYYAGLSWRWGGHGALTLGYNWGEVDRLPAGTSFDEPVDSNLLSSLGSRVDGDWFFGLSYTFLNPGTKPFTNLLTVKEGKEEKEADTAKDTTADQSADGSSAAATGKPLPQSPTWTTGFPKEENKTARLEWEPVDPVGHYEILRSTSGCDDDQPAVVKRVRENSYTDGTIEPGVTYYYTLRAVTNDGASRQSECREVRVPAGTGG
jgi:hypothetical protein